MKTFGFIREWLEQDPYILLKSANKGFDIRGVKSIIQRLKTRQILPSYPHPAQGGTLLSEAMKLPNSTSKAELICTLLQTGANPMERPHPKINSTVLHGMLTEKYYSKSITELLLSYGFDQQEFNKIVKQNISNASIPGKQPKLSETETNISTDYSEAASKIKRALLLENSDHTRDIEEAINLFTDAKERLLQFAGEEASEECIQDDYNMRASHAQTKIHDCQQKLDKLLSENNQGPETHSPITSSYGKLKTS